MFIAKLTTLLTLWQIMVMVWLQVHTGLTSILISSNIGKVMMLEEF
ncbi:hypothetical protein LINPERPRIM_LOCUS6578 [Linum perenne]